MTYDFVGFGRDINAYAIIDIIIVATIVTLLTILFVYRRNLRILAIFLSIVVLEILLEILAGLSLINNGEVVLTVARYILHYVIFAFIVMCCVVYQSDLKAIFQRIANPRGSAGLHTGMNSDDELREATAEILIACQDMAKQDVGAIIIIDTDNGINETILDTGTRLDAELSAALLESIFNTKAPLHDGAVIVRGNKVVAAGCFLPLTQRNVEKEMGTRHRAAIGITEDTNVLSIVVSEETGIISVVRKGEIRRYMTMDKLKDEIEETYGISSRAVAYRNNKFDKRNRGR